jgi:hypothetical protein
MKNYRGIRVLNIQYHLGHCPLHGQTRFRLITTTRQRNDRCALCLTAYHRALRNRLKSEYVKAFGGRCQLCGYSRCLRALHFHHLSPDNKPERVCKAIYGCSRRRALTFLNGTVLLCSNCHAEVEEGRKIPRRVLRDAERFYAHLLAESRPRPLSHPWA